MVMATTTVAARLGGRRIGQGRQLWGNNVCAGVGGEEARQLEILSADFTYGGYSVRSVCSNWTSLVPAHENGEEEIGRRAVMRC